MIGYAVCGSFCTHAAALRVMRELTARGEELLPIVSETVGVRNRFEETCYVKRYSLGGEGQ